jgi:membrane dipeptidase
MIVDLHAHYPMHLVPRGERSVVELVASAPGRARILDVVRAWMLRTASRVGNYESLSSGPRVTVPGLKAGGVGVALSVLISPFDEMDLTLRYGSPPLDRYFPTLLRQLDDTEREVGELFPDQATIALTPAQMDAAIEAGRVALVHCVEGGFHLGSTPEKVDRAVTELARRGVAYITLAHLFWRSVAANEPAIPFLPDRVYRMLFPQPGVGLSELGRAAIRAMVRERVLIDLSHMNGAALRETFALLDDLDPERQVPVIASHVGYRFGRQKYNLDAATIERIAQRGGVIGVILSEHQAADGLRRPRTSSLGESLEVVFRHLDRIREITGSHRHAAIGSDHDGFIKPTLAGLMDSASLGRLDGPLTDRYGVTDARLILSGNALRLLRTHWGPVSDATTLVPEPATLRDGSPLLVRAVQDDDKELIAAGFEKLSPQSRYRRFFAPLERLTSQDLAYLTELDHHDHEAMIGIDPGSGDAIGVARYVRAADPTEAEVAVVVADAWQNRGVATALLERLGLRARHEGVTHFVALVMSDNEQALDLFRHLSPEGSEPRRSASGHLEVVIDIPEPGRIGESRLGSALRAAARGLSMSPWRVFRSRTAGRD